MSGLYRWSAAMAGRLLLATIVLAISVTLGAAHVQRAAAPIEGLPIAAITHGQMRALAPYRGTILNLAARHLHEDETLRRLTNHARIQFAWCLWGLVPGTVRDEESPFNGCAHAYLAAARAVLLRLHEVAPDSPQVRPLVHEVETAMLAEATALELCGFSADAFDTARFVAPEWLRIPTHLPSLALVAMTIAGLVGAAGFHFGLSRRG